MYTEVNRATLVISYRHNIAHKHTILFVNLFELNSEIVTLIYSILKLFISEI